MLFIQRDKLISWTHDEKYTFFLTIRDFDLGITIIRYLMNFDENVYGLFLFINEK